MRSEDKEMKRVQYTVALLSNPAMQKLTICDVVQTVEQILQEEELCINKMKSIRGL